MRRCESFRNRILFHLNSFRKEWAMIDFMAHLRDQNVFLYSNWTTDLPAALPLAKV
ncbi:hypothetical protein Ab1vBOLIVR5_gp165c [Agrobacterium phage OLIVR5]|uniref:Uncharacterized protein n=1 Tax=Agrobacterium phage OLIVR5 TaxID=2723773 RepID=A0A858MTG5_9CAUD|nr:hypothetical protein KNU99_gp236 [Agrobacterium phage OLIVR5]QIW87813.1 hypothetical protein Ab1vBOLIVR5_gp165c [Agrobacterium phage OLIVR5]QIW88078.1 hypothetical protein Ab1vBOLIVR6_gp171c [Agrobacterium phage OLIVR6]